MKKKKTLAADLQRPQAHVQPDRVPLTALNITSGL